MRVVLTLLVLVGCTHAPRRIDAEPDAPPPAIVLAPDAGASHDERIEEAFAAADRDAGAQLTLGSACSGGPLCGTRQRIVLHREIVYRALGAPCKMVYLRPPSLTMMNTALGGCIADDRLYFVDSCMHCRITSSTVVQATIPELKPAQRDYLRGWLQLPADTKLDSRADWERVLTPRP